MISIKKVDDRRAEKVKQAMINLPSPFTGQTFTLTCDDGKEFVEYQRISCALNA